MSINQKAFYLTQQLNGFTNLDNDKVKQVAQSSNNLAISMRINATQTGYYDDLFIDTTVIYNLTDDTFTIKPEGKGSRKYSSVVQSSVTHILNGLISEADKAFKSDSADAILMTELYYSKRIKQAITDTEAATVATNQYMADKQELPYDSSNSYSQMDLVDDIISNYFFDHPEAKQTNEATKEVQSVSHTITYNTSDVKHDNNILLKGLGTNQRYEYIIETTEKDKEIDELYYSNIKRTTLNNMESLISTLNSFQRQGFHNISILINGYDNHNNLIMEDVCNDIDIILNSFQQLENNRLLRAAELKISEQQKELNAMKAYLEKFKAYDSFIKYANDLSEPIFIN
jgi:hypothetical protein